MDDDIFYLNQPLKNKVSKTVGIVDSDRAATAKEKLLAYKNQREQGSVSSFLFPLKLLSNFKL